MAHGTKAKELAKQEFDDWAALYDRSLLNYFLFRPTYMNFIEEIVRWHAPNSTEPFDLLDIGCGTGTLADMIALSNLNAGRVVGLDYSIEMCRQAQKKIAPFKGQRCLSFTNGDSEHLPFADNSFDFITCGNSFHHYPNQAAVVQEMHRLLRPGGRLVIVDGFRDNVVGWVVFDVIITAIEKAVYHVPWPIMRQHFQDAGFQEIKQRKFNFLFPALVTVGTVRA